MASKFTVDELKPGMRLETTFWKNPVAESKHRFRATHLDGRKAPKVVLCSDHRIRAGVPSIVEVVKVHKPDRDDRGWIEVTFVRLGAVRLEGIYLEPMVARKLQILLESGLNILLDGPQGCGKTVMARALADTLGMEFVFFNCSSVVEATDFLATIQVRASETGQPVTDFVKTELLEAFERASQEPEVAFLVFLDEFNRCSESARNVLMPALDSTRRVFNPVDNVFIDVPGNIQFIAAVNRGRAFSGTYGIDAAQLDRFAPLQMDYPPPPEEVKILQARHPELGLSLLRLVVDLADRIRRSPDLDAGLSVRATDEACVYLKHPLMSGDRRRMLPEVLQSSFCGRYSGRWDDPNSDAGTAWACIEPVLKGA